MTFYDRCKESYGIVCGYLDDQDVLVHPQYQFDPEIRQSNKQKITQTIDIFKSCLTKYSLDQVAISYNGGKDCLVMLVILLYTIYDMSIHPQNQGIPITKDFLSNYKLDSVYINSEVPFEQVSDFIKKSTSYYHLNSVMIKCSMKQGFEQYLNQNKNIKTIIVGIRHSDPFGESLKPEQETDHNWPKFIRTHPILHWNYVDVWDFILGCKIEYCEMYDLGYTSLGGVNNTLPNPFLKQNKHYLPAYMLTEDADERERLGRIKST